MLGGHTNFETIVAELKALSKICAFSLDLTTRHLAAIWSTPASEARQINLGPLQFPIDSPGEVGKTLIVCQCFQSRSFFL